MPVLAEDEFQELVLLGCLQLCSHLVNTKEGILERELDNDRFAAVFSCKTFLAQVELNSVDGNECNADAECKGNEGGA